MVLPDGRALVCRASRGAVITRDPRTALSRVVASITQGVQAQAVDQVNAVYPVWWTERGELACLDSRATAPAVRSRPVHARGARASASC